jgi:GNAT superfamily N-acetyltransferase
MTKVGDMHQMRVATVSDASAVADLFLAARAHSIETIPPVVGDYDRALPWLESRIQKGEQCWVTEDASGLSALMLLEPGWIDQLYIRPDAIGQGLGTLLLDKAKALMPDGIQLWTFQSNVRAQKFYEQRGFVAVEWTDGSSNEECEPDVRYVWGGDGN